MELWPPGSPEDFDQLASLIPPVLSSQRFVFLVRLDAHIVATVQLDIDTLPNQPHCLQLRVHHPLL